jgi:hypothetical protein
MMDGSNHERKVELADENQRNPLITNTTSAQPPSAANGNNHND